MAARRIMTGRHNEREGKGGGRRAPKMPGVVVVVVQATRALKVTRPSRPLAVPKPYGSRERQDTQPGCCRLPDAQPQLSSDLFLYERKVPNGAAIITIACRYVQNVYCSSTVVLLYFDVRMVPRPVWLKLNI